MTLFFWRFLHLSQAILHQLLKWILCKEQALWCVMGSIITYFAKRRIGRQHWWRRTLCEPWTDDGITTAFIFSACRNGDRFGVFVHAMTSSSCIRITPCCDNSAVYGYNALPDWCSGSLLLEFFMKSFRQTIMIAPEKRCPLCLLLSFLHSSSVGCAWWTFWRLWKTSHWERPHCVHQQPCKSWRENCPA